MRAGFPSYLYSFLWRFYPKHKGSESSNSTRMWHCHPSCRETPTEAQSPCSSP